MVALADRGDTEGFEKDGEEGQLYAFKLSDGVYKRKKVTAQEGGGAQKLGELSDVDISYAAPRRLHTLAFTGNRWVAFADPVQETGWIIDIRISSPYVATGQHHKVRKVTNSGTRLCSYVPETKNVVVIGQHTLKTSNSREGILKIVSEFSPAGIIGAGSSWKNVGVRKKAVCPRPKKNRLMNLMRDEAMLTARTKLLEELQALETVAPLDK